MPHFLCFGLFPFIFHPPHLLWVSKTKFNQLFIAIQLLGLQKYYFVTKQLRKSHKRLELQPKFLHFLPFPTIFHP